MASFDELLALSSFASLVGQHWHTALWSTHLGEFLGQVLGFRHTTLQQCSSHVEFCACIMSCCTKPVSTWLLVDVVHTHVFNRIENRYTNLDWCSALAEMLSVLKASSVGQDFEPRPCDGISGLQHHFDALMINPGQLPPNGWFFLLDNYSQAETGLQIAIEKYVEGLDNSDERKNDYVEMLAKYDRDLSTFQHILQESMMDCENDGGGETKGLSGVPPLVANSPHGMIEEMWDLEFQQPWMLDCGNDHTMDLREMEELGNSEV